jgi:two-component system KDP operon response regulator KdpE
MNENKLRVLVVDDEPAIRRYLNTALSSQGYDVELAASGREALGEFLSYRPEMLILDLGLPDMDGLELLHRVREFSQVPIIILSVRDQEPEKVRALDEGADDYVTKPFGTGELLARMRVVMRRPAQLGDTPVYAVDDLRVDLARRMVTVGGHEIQLTPTEYDLLRALVAFPGRVLTHRQLMQRVWGGVREDGAHLLRVTMSNLRRKLEPDAARPHYILTEAGVGYRLRVSR